MAGSQAGIRSGDWMNNEDVGGQQRHRTEMRLMAMLCTSRMWRGGIQRNENKRLSRIQFRIGKRKKCREFGCDVPRGSSNFLKNKQKVGAILVFLFQTTRAQILALLRNSRPMAPYLVCN